MSKLLNECFISVDVESSGPIPGEYSLLSIGACLASDESISFECLVKPITNNADPKALEVSGFTLDDLAERGKSPSVAMGDFSAWVLQMSETRKPVFVGLNAAFDWSFVNYYFHRFYGSNPFGFAALDIKALYMGATGYAWSESKSSQMTKVLGISRKGDHNALTDAKVQAELFRHTLSYRDRKGV